MLDLKPLLRTLTIKTKDLEFRNLDLDYVHPEYGDFGWAQRGFVETIENQTNIHRIQLVNWHTGANVSADLSIACGRRQVKADTKVRQLTNWIGIDRKQYRGNPVILSSPATHQE